jgi:hypothetical protein
VREDKEGEGRREDSAHGTRLQIRLPRGLSLDSEGQGRPLNNRTHMVQSLGLTEESASKWGSEGRGNKI